jgi:hypothetical protein
MYPGPRPDRAAAQRKRKAAFARLSRVRGVTLIGAGALTAAVAGVVSAASGRTLGAKHYVRASATVAKVPGNAGSTHAAMPPLASAGQLGLGAPGSAPQSAPPAQPQTQAAAPQSAPAPAQSAPAPAVSGGS